MRDIKVSVIVPIYNVEEYLIKCLNSIVNQDFTKYEVILVNDGSTDSSIDIAMKFCDKYDFFKLINKKNGGLGTARNTAIEHINGKFVVFIDSDDYISSDYISKLYSNITNNNADMAICTHEKIIESNNKNEIINLDIDCSKVYSNIETLKLLFLRKIKCYAWDKIYKTSLFKDNNIRYLENRFYEDIVTTVKLITNCTKVSFINEPLYKYRIREGNITSIKSEKSIIDLNYSINVVNNYINKMELNKNLEMEIQNFNISYTLGSLDMLSIFVKYKTGLFYKEFNRYFADSYLNYSIKDVIKNKSINSWVRRDFILLKLGLLPIKNKIKDRV